MWRDEHTEKSWQTLEQLKNLADFIIIGGWGVYLWTRKLKSRDIDIYIDQENFYKLQSQLLQRNHTLNRNIRLMKFEAKIEDVEVDIYPTFTSNLPVPCLDVYTQKLYAIIQLYKVAIPEVLLLLKAKAAQQRWHAEKGMKDRIDIISLLKHTDMKPDLLKKLSDKYDKQKTLRDTIKKAISTSRIEYKYLGLTYERDGVQLKKSLEKL